MNTDDPNDLVSDPSEGDKPHWLDNPRNVHRLLTLLYTVCGLLVLADFWVHRHVEHPLESLPAFYAVYGFVGCVSLIMAAIELRKWVMRDEGYYGDREED